MLKIGGGSGIRYLGFMGGCYRILENIVRKKLLILNMVAFVDKDGFIYDIYRVTVRYRDTLEEDLEQNYETWLNFAKEEMKKEV